MDLGTIGASLVRGDYTDSTFDYAAAARGTSSLLEEHSGIARFKADLALVWDNCQAFNKKGSEIWKAAGALRVGAHRFVAELLDTPTSLAEQRAVWATAPSPSESAQAWEKHGPCFDDARTVICDGCVALYDWQVLSPPIKKLPASLWGWFCPPCCFAAASRWSKKVRVVFYYRYILNEFC